MSGDQGKRKEGFAGRIEKAKGRLQPSFPEIQQRTSSAVEIAQSIFRQFADDIQLKDLLAKAEALVTKAASTDTAATETFRDVTPSNEVSNRSGAKKTRARLKKAAPKKAAPKKKKRAPKRKAKTRA
jgi:hypothetical protein